MWNPGYDLITGKILKELSIIGIKYRTQLFNAVLLKGYFPAQGKGAQIIIILKPGKPRNELTSYRPITLIPIVSKVFENILLKRLVPMVENNRLIPNHQFGFTALPQQQNPALQNHPETDLDLWYPTLGYGFHIQRRNPGTFPTESLTSDRGRTMVYAEHLLSDAISTCQRSRKKSATTALTTASASVHTQTTSSQPSSSHQNTGDYEDSCPTICLPDSYVIVVISTLVCKT
jgi:hypothetical protein